MSPLTTAKAGHFLQVSSLLPNELQFGKILRTIKEHPNDYPVLNGKIADLTREEKDIFFKTHFNYPSSFPKLPSDADEWGMEEREKEEILTLLKDNLAPGQKLSQRLLESYGLEEIDKSKRKPIEELLPLFQEKDAYSNMHYTLEIYEGHSGHALYVSLDPPMFSDPNIVDCKTMLPKTFTFVNKTEMLLHLQALLELSYDECSEFKVSSYIENTNSPLALDRQRRDLVEKERNLTRYLLSCRDENERNKLLIERKDVVQQLIPKVKEYIYDLGETNLEKERKVQEEYLTELKRVARDSL